MSDTGREARADGRVSAVSDLWSDLWSGTCSATSITAILLAAGSSRRFGAANKLLALLDGKPLVRHAAELLAGAGFAEMIVVTGPDADEVRRVLDGLPLRFVHNDLYLEGMGGSVATGIRAVAPTSTGALVALGDMPRLDPALLSRLVETFCREGGGKIVFPALPDGSQRNPVLWPRHLFCEVGALTGEQGAKAILMAHKTETVAVPASPEAFTDIDTVEDLARLQRI